MKTYLQKHDHIKYSNHWSTPKEIYDSFVIEQKYHDPCPLYSNSFDFNYWNELGKLFINPPYSEMTKWIDFSIKYNLATLNEVVLLIPARTDTKYFHQLLTYGVDIEFIKGRLKFGNSKTCAPFPSLLIYIRDKHDVYKNGYVVI